MWHYQFYHLWELVPWELGSCIHQGLLENKQEKGGGRRRDLKFYCEKLVHTFTETETFLSSSREVRKRRASGVMAVRAQLKIMWILPCTVFSHVGLQMGWDPPMVWKEKMCLLILLAQTKSHSKTPSQAHPKWWLVKYLENLWSS